MLNDIKELQALLKLCRKHGVTDFQAGDLHLKFGDLPPKGAVDTDDSEVATPGDLTPEQLMFFSVGGER